MSKLFGAVSGGGGLCPASAEETHGTYIKVSDRPACKLIRQTFDGWFERYPSAHGKDLRNRFFSSEKTQHFGAFFELYCHELLIRHGYAVEVHPEGDPNRSKVPDFLATHVDLGHVFLEATIVHLEEEYRREQRLAPLLDKLNSLQLPGHCLSVQVRDFGPGTPAFKRIAARLRQKHDALTSGAPYDFDPSRFSVDDAGWSFRFGFIPVSKPLLRTVGMRTSNVFYDDISEPIRRAVAKKSASKYGDLSHPYIVAINCVDSFSSPEMEIATSLAPVNGQPTEDGAWYKGGHWRRQTQSALLIAEGLHTFTIFSVSPTLWIHPFPARSLKDAAFRLPRYARTDVEEWTLIEGEPAQEIMDIATSLPPDDE